MRYDAAIIGAGAEGLAAAVTLAKTGRNVVVLERNALPGGRCITREFHPGFRASPFCDEIPQIPVEIFWALDLARHGALFAPSPISTALWPDRGISFRSGEVPLQAEAAALAKAVLSRAETEIEAPSGYRFWSPAPRGQDPWPADSWAMQSLTSLLGPQAGDGEALLAASALEGSLAHPEHAGTALHLLTSSGCVQTVGGLQGLTNSLMSACLAAGVNVSCGLEVTDIHCRGDRIAGLRLADGEEIAVSTIISTLDLKRTFLSLFAWDALPGETARRAGCFRMNGGTARILVALDALPERPRPAYVNAFSGPIHLSPSLEGFGAIYAAWRSGVVAEQLPVTVRFASTRDPRLCPPGAATLTATVDGVPARLFDGSWTHEKRHALLAQVLDAIERAIPGTSSRVRACDLMVPPDIEQALGCTEGDLAGGEIAADQMLAFRPWHHPAAPRTPIQGLYLAGPSTTAGVLGTCVSGVLAARAVAADLRAGALR
ncbi:MAG TPA: NAD(P)/FAD-dependent oxidoreductase [Rhizomicrobium sp.]|nr:NAD(P)/FAD-dependent oxidoreductase [Rhizomicrobium sp.]